MTVVRRFEELDCWRHSRELVLLVFTISKDGRLSKDFGTRDQLRRAAISVMNNIAEGFGRKSIKEFIRFLDISQSSCMEVKSMTYALEDLQYLSLEKALEIREKAEVTRNITRGLIKHLRNSNLS